MGAEENFDEPGHVRGDSDATLEPDTIARKGSRASQLAAGWGRRSGRKEKRKEGGIRAAMRKMYAYGSAPLRVLLLG